MVESAVTVPRNVIAGGKYDMEDVIQPIYDEINEQYGLNEKQD